MADMTMGKEKDSMERYFSVYIETWGMGVDSVTPDSVASLADALEACGALGPTSSIGGLPGGVGATFGVTLLSARDVEALAKAAETAGSIFAAACEKAGIPRGEIAHMDILSGDLLTMELDQPAETYAGVTELAKMFGVSRQRMSELRTRKDFPAPIADLAAGPVWAVSSLTRFLEEWDRKPGRPRKIRIEA